MPTRPDPSPAAEPTGLTATPLPAAHARRLRDLYRSSGWPSQDAVEVELLARGLVERIEAPRDAQMPWRLRLTDAGIHTLATALRGNRARRNAHEALVERVARTMQGAGRIVWRGLSLRAQLAPPPPSATAATGAADVAGAPDAAAPATPKARWCVAMPDVFSIRHTTVEAYCEPVVHEIKVSRADLLGDLRRADKRQAYLDLGGECWYVLGRDGRGRAIGTADDVPPECGVLIELDSGRLDVARPAPRRPMPRLPFHVWMALARATPLAPFDDEAQGLL